MWIARDKDGELDLYLTKPIRFNYQNLPIEDDCLNNDFWDTDDEYWHIDPSLFPNLKWEDEPLQVELNEIGLPSVDAIENVLTCIAEYYADVFRNGVQPEESRREQAQKIREYITMYYDYWLPMNERGVELPRTKSNEQDEEEVQEMQSNTDELERICNEMTDEEFLESYRESTKGMRDDTEYDDFLSERHCKTEITSWTDVYNGKTYYALRVYEKGYLQWQSEPCMDEECAKEQIKEYIKQNNKHGTN